MPLLLTPPLHGLVVPPHTPFHADGALHLAIVEQQAAHYLKHRINAVFIAGSTGESTSLSLQERLALTERWMQVTSGTALRVVVHVGANCLDDAREIAAHAQAKGAAAIAAFSPSYFKPPSMDALVRCAAHIAEAAPETPFYFYDIPVLTGVTFAMPQFLALAHDRIPTLAGIKFTNSDLAAYQFCLRANGGIWDLPWGIDQHFLGALAMGAKGAVGSSYNYAAPIYHRMLDAFAKGDISGAREAQFQATRTLALTHSYGALGAAKHIMKCLGVDVGPVRLPNEMLSLARQDQLRADLEQMGFFDWIA